MERFDYRWFNNERSYWDNEWNYRTAVSNPINVETNITVDVAIDVKVEVTTNMKLKLILNKSVEEPIHFLAIVKNVPAKEIN
ncbi:hypothetical protein J1N35_005574 [Gossypium stocksii]|uniref:Uncharacterized protein n=1 Tax=Gossypium stocksii TaxID=47602 RepID=A0A9D3WD61_9ROSI|nr:hypothetical protein J1N35_005574 [Gossypium stocksii]